MRSHPRLPSQLSRSNIAMFMGAAAWAWTMSAGHLAAGEVTVERRSGDRLGRL